MAEVPKTYKDEAWHCKKSEWVKQLSWLSTQLYYSVKYALDYAIQH